MSLRLRLALTILVTAIPLALALIWLRADTRHRAQERSLEDFVTTVMRAGGRSMCESFPDMFSGGHSIFGPERVRIARATHVEGMPDLSEVFEGLEGPEGLKEMLEGLRGLQAGESPDGGMPAFPPVAMHPPEAPPEHHFAMWAYRADLEGASERTPAMPAAIRAALAGGAPTASEVFERQGVSVLRMGLRMPWEDGPCAVMVAERALPRTEDDPVVFWGLAILCGGVLLAVFLAAGPLVRRIRRLQADVRTSAASGYVDPVDVQGRDEIADLARTFNEAGTAIRSHVASVEAREETLRRFVADTTHDVMTPLTVLQGHLASLQTGAAAGQAVDPVAIHASLEEAHYMGSLLHNLDAVAKLESAATDLTTGRVDLGALVGRVALRHRPIARTRDIAVEFTVPDTPVEVSGDVTLLEQAVSNVVHNAVRYNNDGGHVSVLLDADAEGFVLRVLDDGPGVPAGEMPRLAERRFRSAEARTRRADGRGIGLAIAQDVAERHGLTLAFANLAPHGLEARFEGPCAPRA